MKTKIVLSGECGNSPKNAFAENFAVALLSGDSTNLQQRLAKDCTLIAPGNPDPIDAATSIAALADPAPQTLTILHAITHGRVGAVNGVMEAKGKEKEKGFALFLEFKNTKAESVSAIRLYFA